MDLMARLCRLSTNTPWCKSYGCLHGKIRGMDYLTHLLRILEPNRMSRIPLDEALRSIKTTSITKTDYQCKSTSTHVEPDFETRIRETTKQFKRDLCGLCLACVRTGSDHNAHTGGQSQ